MNFSKAIIIASTLIFSLASSSIFAQQISNHSKSQTQMMSINTLVAITPDTIKWVDGPDSLPSGAQYAILEGSLKGKGPVTIRLKLPANYQVAPHSLSAAQRATVISGSVNVAMGDKMDTSTGTLLTAGSFVTIPANKHYYIWTSEDSVIQVSTMGPLTVKYVDPKNDPRKNKTSTQTPSQNGSSPTMPNNTQTPNGM